MRTHNKARQYSDQMHCPTCGKQWDVNDIDPPSCIDGHELFLQQRAKLKQANEDERRSLKPNRSS
ncbi:hypothetical protein NVP1049O_02 [Vibrio phage 1.049.O._10N.286.54.B5]|nr:hypothetical protein NVP1049O_02 [Vibrio phage 1.049.O._10N.286.54.B5]AUR84171.1 hypothetical protein NVP1050O_02 [Vibrio phage 1.050.O._10N.286.48.A6]AUR84382.1 hypothetical protein NVP1055O_06 [Vibrio phage 1.055.O._10N.286.55.E9]